MIYQLKISLAGAHPPIWRRVLVPARSTLAELHQVIQALMGWQDAHLHQFELPAEGQTSVTTRRSRRDARLFGPTTDPLGQPFDWLLDEEMEDEAKAILEEVAPDEKAHFLYIYDMGDSWEHDILVEKKLPEDSAGVYPLCLTGKRNGPIEDCGGVWGYEEMLDILADPTHEEHLERKAWLKEVYDVSSWDSAAFDAEKVNQRLRHLPSRTASGRPI